MVSKAEAGCKEKVRTGRTTPEFRVEFDKVWVWFSLSI